MIRILVVDDSALYRQLVRNVLRDVPGVEVVGAAGSGQEALDQIELLAPDLITLDVNMPGINGIEVLRQLRKRSCATKAIMLSGFTAQGAQVTTDALLEGAFDFILKPAGANAEANRTALLAALSEKIQAYRSSHARRAPKRSTSPAASPTAGMGRLPASRTTADAPFEVVVVGTSTGGPVALRQILPQLPGDLPVPILVVQHMPPQYTHSLAQRLNEASQIEVVEACEGMTLEAGWAFIAPGGRQMKIARRGGRLAIQLTDDPPEHSCRPSVDYLFRSAAEVLSGKVLAIVLTGMGRDGTEGCRLLKNRGATVVAQHPEGCVVYGMPKAVADEQLADHVLPLESIAEFVIRQVRSKRKMGR
ncbi:MAG TPA: chemotaxis response regulator protein-glutamate methylesterase [Pirellulales bacterium]|nr:chemotaxis response regulator protein-glutamate methylesterase [Pirellulales bacterium]